MTQNRIKNCLMFRTKKKPLILKCEISNVWKESNVPGTQAAIDTSIVTKDELKRTAKLLTGIVVTSVTITETRMSL